MGNQDHGTVLYSGDINVKIITRDTVKVIVVVITGPLGNQDHATASYSDE